MFVFRFRYCQYVSTKHLELEMIRLQQTDPVSKVMFVFNLCLFTSRTWKRLTPVSHVPLLRIYHRTLSLVLSDLFSPIFLGLCDNMRNYQTVYGDLFDFLGK